MNYVNLCRPPISVSNPLTRTHFKCDTESERLHFQLIPTRCLSALSHSEDARSSLCDKYPQKQGLVLSDFIHIKAQAAIGEPVGKTSEQEEDAGDI